MKKNAIILAAGKSSKFAPFTYEKPKGLFRVKGEILIERQIEQLLEAGISEIYLVVGRYFSANANAKKFIQDSMYVEKTINLAVREIYILYI